MVGRGVVVDDAAENEHVEWRHEAVADASQGSDQHQQLVYAVSIPENPTFFAHFSLYLCFTNEKIAHRYHQLFIHECKTTDSRRLHLVILAFSVVLMYMK